MSGSTIKYRKGQFLFLFTALLFHAGCGTRGTFMQEPTGGALVGSKAPFGGQDPSGTADMYVDRTGHGDPRNRSRQDSLYNLGINQYDDNTDPFRGNRTEDWGGLPWRDSLLPFSPGDSIARQNLLRAQICNPSVTNDRRGVVHGLYMVLLGRAGSLAEIDQWIQTGYSLPYIARNIMESQEYFTNLLSAMYQRTLKRNADPTGVQAWLPELARGRQEWVLAQIMGSGEYFGGAGNDFNQFITRVYGDLLDRLPENGIAKVWADYAAAHGNSRAEVALAVLQSSEFRTKFIQTTFQAFLKRAPSAGEVGVFLGLIGSGASLSDIVYAIVSSDEFAHQWSSIYIPGLQQACG